MKRILLLLFLLAMMPHLFAQTPDENDLRQALISSYQTAKEEYKAKYDLLEQQLAENKITIEQYRTEIKDLQDGFKEQEILTVDTVEPFSAIDDYQKAVEYYKNAIGNRKNTYGENHIALVSPYEQLGGLYFNNGEYGNAMENIEKALIIMESIYGENHPRVAKLYQIIGVICTGQSNFEVALEYLNKASEIQKNVLGENHPDLVDTYFKTYSVYFIGLKDYANSFKIIDKALSTQIKLFGEDDPSVKGLEKNKLICEYFKAVADHNLKSFFDNHYMTVTTIQNETPIEEYILLGVTGWDYDSEISLFDALGDDLSYYGRSKMALCRVLILITKSTRVLALTSASSSLTKKKNNASTKPTMNGKNSIDHEEEARSGHHTSDECYCCVRMHFYTISR